ncbi:MAG: hypothetical protein RBG13Loki_2051 [Promethearchaeota archaeon CR_4]|nr:MAG: hypothetical protein RBG13Loki_2051 [Candidatus Lokiarchaeota archaeon CR_4]
MIKSNPEEFKKLETNPNESPFVMLNLLKFKSPGGAAAYNRYTKEASVFLKKVGGKVLYMGKANEMLNGEERWDFVLLVQYPSRKAFIQMINNPDYLKTHELRVEGTERAVLYVTDPVKIKDSAGK